MPLMNKPIKEFFRRFTGEVPQIVYHYCGPDAFVGIVKSMQIWATSAHCLNDLSERTFASELIQDTAREIAVEYGFDSDSFEATPAAVLLQRVEESISYVSCFSEHPDLLSQWRAYAPPMGGFAVGIRTSSLASGGDWLFGRCEYDRSRQIDAAKSILKVHASLLDPKCSLDELIDTSDTGVSSLIAALLTLVPLLKHPGFREEAEWRVVRGPVESEDHPTEYRTARSSVIPFQRLDLTSEQGGVPIAEVIIGPSPRSRGLTYGATRLLLNHHGLESCELRTSDIPYRGW